MVGDAKGAVHLVNVQEGAVKARYVCLFVCLFVCVCLFACLFVSVPVYICVCLSVFACVCLPVCVCVCVCLQCVFMHQLPSTISISYNLSPFIGPLLLYFSLRPSYHNSFFSFKVFFTHCFFVSVMLTSPDLNQRLHKLSKIRTPHRWKQEMRKTSQ